MLKKENKQYDLLYLSGLINEEEEYGHDFINLTEHEIKIINNEQENSEPIVFKPSGETLRVSSNHSKVGKSKGINLYHVDFGDLELIENSSKKVIGSLPPVKINTIYIVSAMCLEAIHKKHPERTDFASPGKLVRDSKGVPIGTEGLRIK